MRKQNFLGAVSRTFLMASAIVLGMFSSAAHAVTAVQSGNWSNSSTWGGSMPGVEEDVIIPVGITVTLNTSDEVGEVLVQGKLTVATGTYELIADSVVVMGGSAEFEVGTSASRYAGDFTLTLKGLQSENFTHMTHDMGARALLALMGGTINLHGEDRVEWTVLGADVNAGASQITMAEAVDWLPGDEILIVSSTTDWNEMEKMTVSSVTGGGTVVNLTSNLAYWHCGTVQQYTRPSDSKTWTADMRAEVGLLNRNITVQGASDSVASGFGAHIMVHGPDNGAMMSGKAYIEGIEVYRGGQESILGRYPFHWHLVVGDGAGQYFNDSAIHDSFNRGVTIHGTDFTTVDNNFMYNVIGHTLFLEDGVEENNTITNNVVALTLRPAPGTEVTPSDNELNQAQNRTPASYWITHPNNIVENNVAAGGPGTGFWYIFPWKRVGPSANLTYYDGKPLAYQAPMGTFNGNVAHSYMNGWDIFDGLDTDHSIATNRGWDNATDHVFENALWYANETALYSGTGQQGTGFPVENVIKRNNVIVDNTFASMLASSTTIEESVFVARSGLPLNPDPRRIGHKLYDGAPDFNDCYFVGWDAPLPMTSLIQTTGGATQRINWGFSGVETDHPGTNMSMSLNDFDFGDAWEANTASMAHPRKWENVLSDGDGTLTGLADSSLVANHPWYFTGSETPYAGSQNIYHVPHKFARITQHQHNRTGTHHIFTREKSGTPTETYFHVNGFEEHNSFAAIVNEDFEYSITFWETQSYNPARWEMWDAEPGDVAIVKFNHMDNVNGLVPTGTAYSSVAQIMSPASTTTGHYLDGNGVLWFRVIADANGYRDFGFAWSSGSAAYVYNGSDDLDLDGRSNDAEGGPSLDTDGDGLPDYADDNNDSDGMSDKDELFYGLDPESAADLRYEFGEHGGDGWWTPNSTQHRDNVDGAYEYIAGAGNRYMQLAGTADISFPGNIVDTITVRWKSDTSGTSQFLWWRAGAGTASLAGMNYTGGSGYVEETFTLSGNSNWDGHDIIQLRFRGPNVTGAVVTVDYIRANGQGDLPGGGGNNPPVFSNDPMNEPNATEGVTYAWTIAGSATDADDDPLTYSKLSGPDWLSIASNGALTGIPGAGDVGVNQWMVQVDDGNGGTDTATLSIIVFDTSGCGSIILIDDDFENFNATGWTTDWFINTTYYVSSTSCILANLNMDELTTPAMDLTSFDSITLQFWFSDSAIDADDDVRLQYWNGTGWSDLGHELGDDEAEDVWLFFDETFTTTSHPELFRADSQIRIDSSGLDTDEYILVDDWYQTGSATCNNGPTDVVYVDFGYSGTETGAENTPWNTLSEALSVVDANGIINIIKDSGDNDSSETFSGGTIIDQNVTLNAVDGTVRIGVL